MLIRFTVTAFVTNEWSVGLVGSIPSLGNWKPEDCVPLSAIHVNKDNVYVPNAYTVVVDIQENEFAFKFIMWKSLYSNIQNPIVRKTIDRNGYRKEDFALPAIIAKSGDSGIENRLILKELENIIWDGTGTRANRNFCLKAEESPLPRSHVYDPSNILEEPIGLCYNIPPMVFEAQQKVDSDHTEYTHTMKYFGTISRLKELNYNFIVPNIICGSAPRKLSHVEILKSNNVMTVVNLQSAEDIKCNWIDDENYPRWEMRTATELVKIYKKEGLNFINIPTTDMCSRSRQAMMAQSAWTVAGIVAANPDRSVYIHCNAGVGRAVACTTAFLKCALRLPLIQVVQLMYLRRPVSYVDVKALRFAQPDFDRKFLNAMQYLPLISSLKSEVATKAISTDTETRTVTSTPAEL